MHSITVFQKGRLKEIMLQSFPDKYISVDKGYKTSEQDKKMLSFPLLSNPLSLKKFKSLSCCREEDINGQMSKFKVLNHEFVLLARLSH